MSGKMHPGQHVPDDRVSRMVAWRKLLPFGAKGEPRKIERWKSLFRDGETVILIGLAAPRTEDEHAHRAAFHSLMDVISSV